MASPFHEGEKKIQDQTGERDVATLNGRLIADRIAPNARPFIIRLRYCVLGWTLPDKSIWSSFVAGEEGFASADSEGAIVRVQLPGKAELPPVFTFQEGDQLGTLFIELSTRRRLRVNGQVTRLDDGAFCLKVSEAYPNCPKYIQHRELVSLTARSGQIDLEEGTSLNGELEAWIRGADTFFVASAHPEGLMDVSHRGGRSGFIKLENGRLRIPDYPGNSMFGTLGNFAVNPRAGLVFVDFRGNRQLQLTGDVALNLDTGSDLEMTGGTGRWWEFNPHKWIVSSLNLGCSWSAAETSPFNP